MAVKDVNDYFIKIAKDYKDMKNTLEELEKTITEESAKSALNNLDNIKLMVEKMKENYMRISYIMFLLNQPTKKSKKDRYLQREKKKFNLTKGHQLEDILKEDKDIIDNLKSLNKE